MKKSLIVLFLVLVSFINTNLFSIEIDDEIVNHDDIGVCDIPEIDIYKEKKGLFSNLMDKHRRSYTDWKGNKHDHATLLYSYSNNHNNITTYENFTDDKDYLVLKNLYQNRYIFTRVGINNKEITRTIGGLSILNDFDNVHVVFSTPIFTGLGVVTNGESLYFTLYIQHHREDNKTTITKVIKFDCLYEDSTKRDILKKLFKVIDDVTVFNEKNNVNQILNDFINLDLASK